MKIAQENVGRTFTTIALLAMCLDSYINQAENGMVTETIKIISHSQGSAYAAGISKVLTDAGYKVEVEYNIAPKQPSDIPVTKADRRVQYGSPGDFIAPQENIPGVDEYLQDVPKDKQGISTGGGHTLDNYDYIFQKSKKDEGYVAPRKDIQENGSGIYGLIIMLLMFLGSACKNLEEQFKCLEKQQKEIKSTDVYKTVYLSFSDTLTNWINSRTKAAQHLEDEDWKIDDAILFNSDQDKCILFILERDMTEGTKLDNIKLILGVKNIYWRFFYKSMPSLTAVRENVGKTEPFSFEELSQMAKEQIIQGGYFKKGTCKINDKYVNEWMEEKHQEFLEGE